MYYVWILSFSPSVTCPQTVSMKHLSLSAPLLQIAIVAVVGGGGSGGVAGWCERGPRGWCGYIIADEPSCGAWFSPWVKGCWPLMRSVHLRTSSFMCGSVNTLTLNSRITQTQSAKTWNQQLMVLRCYGSAVVLSESVQCNDNTGLSRQ